MLSLPVVTVLSLPVVTVLSLPSLAWAGVGVPCCEAGRLGCGEEADVLLRKVGSVVVGAAGRGNL